MSRRCQKSRCLTVVQFQNIYNIANEVKLEPKRFAVDGYFLMASIIQNFTNIFSIVSLFLSAKKCKLFNEATVRPNKKLKLKKNKKIPGFHWFFCQQCQNDQANQKIFYYIVCLKIKGTKGQPVYRINIFFLLFPSSSAPRSKCLIFFILNQTLLEGNSCGF